MKKFIIVSLLLVVLVGCEAVAPTEESSITKGEVFLNSIPEDVFDNLSVEDLPSWYGLFHGYNPPDAVIWNDNVYLSSYPYVLEYDFDGNMVGYSDPNLIECNQGIEILGDNLFVGCFGVGVYQVDLKTNQLVYKYDQTNGLDALQNIQLATDGEMIWVATFDGVGKIDPSKKSVDFYTTELGFPSVQFNSRVYARNGEVWVEMLASDNNNGGAARYDSDTDSWEAYDSGDFVSGDARVEFDRFIVSDNGVYVVVHEEDDVLERFDETTNEWVEVYRAPYEIFEMELSEYLPPFNSYSYFECHERDEVFNVLKDDGQFVNLPISFKYYYDIVKFDDDTYYLLSSKGIEKFSRGDAFPHNIFKSDLVFTGDKKSRLFLSDDKKTLVFFSVEFQEYGGIDLRYGVGGYDIESGEFFGKEFIPENTVAVPIENVYVQYADDKITIDLGDGTNLSVDKEN